MTARREYQQLREHVAEYDVVVAHELDRLGRSFADLAGFVEDLRENGIDIDLVNQPIGTVGEDDEIITRQLTDVTAEVRRHVGEHFETNRADNVHYPDAVFYDLQSHMGMTNTAAEQGTTLFDDQTTREVGSPDGDTHLRTIKQFTREDFRTSFDDATEQIFRKLKQRNLPGLTDRLVTVAIDITNWEYYGDRENAEMVLGTKSDDDHLWAYQFATLTVVSENMAFTPAMDPVEKGMIVIKTNLHRSNTSKCPVR